MLGSSIHDPSGVESSEGGVLGLGLLDVVTIFAPQKSTAQVRGRVVAGRGLLEGMAGLELMGYEIHMGQTKDSNNAGVFHIYETPEGQADYLDGAINAKGTVLGTYMHGLFHNPAFRQTMLNTLRRRRGLPEKWGSRDIKKEQHYDKLAELVRGSLDMSAIYKIVEQGVGD